LSRSINIEENKFFVGVAVNGLEGSLKLGSISQVVLGVLAHASSSSSWANNRSNPKLDRVVIAITSVRPDSKVDVSILVWEFALEGVDNSSISDVVSIIVVAVVVVVVVWSTTISCVDFKRGEGSFNSYVVVSGVGNNSKKFNERKETIASVTFGRS